MKLQMFYMNKYGESREGRERGREGEGRVGEREREMIGRKRRSDC
jgi:hypothetical protein